MVAGAFWSQDRFVLNCNGKQSLITRENNPGIYWGVEAGILVVGASLLVLALYRDRMANRISPKWLGWLAPFWRMFYTVGAGYTVFGGYGSLAPERTAHTNADWVFVILSFVILCVFPLGAMAYSRKIGVESFRRPSFDRWPLGWWNDTLQPLRVTLVGTALTFVGACLALPKADQRGVMTAWWYGAMTLGLFIGERLVYRIYSRRIV